MLEGIDQIAWSGLTHARGPASDVPDYLRQLASPKLSEREAALHELRRVVYHQRKVYEVTASLLPFLVEIAADSKQGSRGEILELVDQLCRSASYGQPEGWSKAAREAARGQLGRLVGLLSDPEALVRIMAARAAADSGDVESAAPALKARLAVEPDSPVRQNLVMALAVLGDREALLGSMRDDRSALVRHAAAIELADALGEKRPPEVTAALLHALDERVQLAPRWAASPMREGGFVAATCRALIQVGLDQARELVPPLLERMRTASTEDGLDLCGCLLHLTLSRGRSPLGWQVLEEISEVSALWAGNKIAAMLKHYGLPDDRAALRKEIDACASTFVQEE